LTAEKGYQGVWLSTQESGKTIRARSETLHSKLERLGGVFVDARDRCKTCRIWPR